MNPIAASSWFGVDLRWLYSDMLHSVLRRTRCHQRAGDVLHDALLRYARAASRQPVAQPHAYLRTVVDSVLADHARGEARFVAWPEPEGIVAGAPAACAPPAEVVADLRQRLAHLHVVLQSLPPRCREVFWLLRVEGHTQAAVADTLGLSLKTVEGHVARALCQLAELRDTYLR